MLAQHQFQKLAFESLILMLLGGYLFIDSLNGFLVLKLGLPSLLSPLFKQGLLVLLLIYGLYFSRVRLVAVLGCLAIVVTWALMRFFLVDDIRFLFAFQEAIKLVYLFIVVLFVSDFDSLKRGHLNRVVLFCLFVLILNIASTFAGIGQTTYGDYGAKGFFYAGNAVSGVIVLCASVALYNAYQRSFIWFCILAIFLCLLAVVIGTKSAILGILLISMLVVICNLNLKSSLLSLLALVILAGTGYMLYEALLEHELYKRLLHFYRIGGVEKVLFSGRDIKLAILWPHFLATDWASFLFGMDIRELARIGVPRVEFDWIDMQINFGIILTLITYAAYCGLFFKLLMLPKNPVVISAIISFPVLMLISTIAGHVLYNGMVTPLWALLLATAIRSSRVDEYNVDENRHLA